MTAPQVGDLVVAQFRPLWENKGGKPYTVTGEVWKDEPWPALMVGPHALAGAVSVDVVERAS